MFKELKLLIEDVWHLFKNIPTLGTIYGMIVLGFVLSLDLFDSLALSAVGMILFVLTVSGFVLIPALYTQIVLRNRIYWSGHVRIGLLVILTIFVLTAVFAYAAIDSPEDSDKIPLGTGMIVFMSVLTIAAHFIKGMLIASMCVWSFVDEEHCWNWSPSFSLVIDNRSRLLFLLLAIATVADMAHDAMLVFPLFYVWVLRYILGMPPKRKVAVKKTVLKPAHSVQ